ncbi:MAG: carbon-nitrogen hydrolase [Acidiferrobacterales bacterium]
MKKISEVFKVALVQQDCTKNQEKNLAKSIAEIQSAAQAGAQLVVLQELHSNLYFCQSEDSENFDLAETIPGPLTEKLSGAAKENKIVIVGSVFEKRAASIYHNTAVVLDSDGSLAGCYRKMHIPDDPGYYEKYYFAPGDNEFKPIKTSVGKLGVMVCWDQWYPEAARCMALNGAEILIYPTAIGWDPDDDKAEKQRQLDSWQVIQRSHAIANNLPLICCNRTGHEADLTEQSNGIDFWGHSFITGPQGEILAQASGHEAQTLISEIDLGRTESVRRIWPFFRDRRIDAYDALTKRFGK